MAKVKNPLNSLEASGPLGASIRYARQRGQDRAVARQRGTAARSPGQNRQGSIISEGARLWMTVAGKGPETRYQTYIANLSNEDWFFWDGAILLEWSYDQLLVAN